MTITNSIITREALVLLGDPSSTETRFTRIAETVLATGANPPVNVTQANANIAGNTGTPYTHATRVCMLLLCTHTPEFGFVQ